MTTDPKRSERGAEAPEARGRSDQISDPLQARAAVDAAVERAAGAGKRVAVIFGADWCSDSLALDTALEHRLVRPLVEPSFEVVKIDVGNRDQNLSLASELGIDPARGLPALAVLDGDGEVVASLNEGQLADARSMSPLEIATVFHRLAPEDDGDDGSPNGGGSGGGGSSLPPAA